MAYAGEEVDFRADDCEGWDGVVLAAGLFEGKGVSRAVTQCLDSPVAYLQLEAISIPAATSATTTAPSRTSK